MLELAIIDRSFSVCQIIDLSEVNFSDEFVFVSKTDDELSLVCFSDSVPDAALSVEANWRALKISGVLDFSMVGVLSKISGLLARAQISLFVISTYNTDYILIKNDCLGAAVDILRKDGYAVISKS